MGVIYALLIIVAIIAVVIYVLTRKSALERRARKAERLTLNVWVEQGEPNPNTGLVSIIIGEFIDEARAKGYKIDKDVHVAFLKPDGFSAEGLPVFEIKSNAYENSVYSMENGKVKIGGIFFVPDLVVVPTQRTDAEMREVLRHELLHWCFFVADRAKYNATKVHRQGEVFEL